MHCVKPKVGSVIVASSVVLSAKETQLMPRATGGVAAAVEMLSGPPLATHSRNDVQCDAAEFLLFVLDVLQAPRIPLVQTFHHGGDEGLVEDCRVVTGRSLQVRP